MFNEKSCGNCIKFWSKCLMWICAFLICLGGIIAICQIVAKTEKEVQILQAKCDSGRWNTSIIDNECEIAAVKNAAIRPIILILIGVVVTIFINRFFWGMCFGFGIITHSHSLI